MVRIAFASFVILGLSFIQADHPNTDLAKLQQYKKWRLVTPKPVDMSPQISVLCRRPSIIDTTLENPHTRTVFRIFVNKIGAKAMDSKGTDPYPVGSIVVKEKFVRPASAQYYREAKLSSDAKPELLTAMIKRRSGFDTKNGDWQYVVMSGDAKKMFTNGLEACASCHESQKSRDYVFGVYGRPH